MVKSTKPSFPWDQIKAESMRSLCRDLGLKQPHTTRSTMIDFLESVWKVGLPKALDNASAATSTTPSSALRTSQKRTRDTPTTVTTASSDELSPSKRHRRGPDVTSDYNTRYKADRRGRLSDPGPIERRSGRPSANGTAILSAVVGRPVRTSKKRRLSPVAAATRSASRAGNLTSAARRPGRRVTLGEPLTSDATADDYEEEEEEEEEETSISAGGAKRRRVVVTPPIIRTRKQKEKEEGASAASTRRRASTSTPKRVALNGVPRMNDEYQPEQDEDDNDYEDEEEEGEGSAKIRHLPRRLPRRFQPRRRRSSASPSKPRAATASPRQPRSSRTSPKRPARMGAVVATKAGRGRPRRRPRANSVKFVFDGVDVPPVNVAWKKKKKTDDETVHDEDADGEIDEEVHPPSAPVVGMPKEREVTEEQEGEEAQEPTEAGEPEEEHEQEGGEDEEKVEAGEVAAEEQIPERQEEAGEAAQPEEEEEEEEQVETGGVAEEQEQAEDEDETMDQGEDQVGIGLIPDDTSSLGNSNKENEAPEGQVEETTTDDAAEMAAQTVLFGAPITVTMTRVEYIVGGGDDDGVEGMEGMEGIEGDIENMDDDMQGPTVEDINLFIA